MVWISNVMLRRNNDPPLDNDDSSSNHSISSVPNLVPDDDCDNDNGHNKLERQQEQKQNASESNNRDRKTATGTAAAATLVTMIGMMLLFPLLLPGNLLAWLQGREQTLRRRRNEQEQLEHKPSSPLASQLPRDSQNRREGRKGDITPQQQQSQHRRSSRSERNMLQNQQQPQQSSNETAVSSTCNSTQSDNVVSIRIEDNGMEIARTTYNNDNYRNNHASYRSSTNTHSGSRRTVPFNWFGNDQTDGAEIIAIQALNEKEVAGGGQQQFKEPQLPSSNSVEGDFSDGKKRKKKMQKSRFGETPEVRYPFAVSILLILLFAMAVFLGFYLSKQNGSSSTSNADSNDINGQNIVTNVTNSSNADINNNNSDTPFSEKDSDGTDDDSNDSPSNNVTTNNTYDSNRHNSYNDDNLDNDILSNIDSVDVIVNNTNSTGEGVNDNDVVQEQGTVKYDDDPNRHTTRPAVRECVDEYDASFVNDSLYDCSWLRQQKPNIIVSLCNNYGDTAVVPTLNPILQDYPEKKVDAPATFDPNTLTKLLFDQSCQATCSSKGEVVYDDCTVPNNDRLGV